MRPVPCSPGFIAGVTNPLFEQRQQWWDVLCNIATGEVTESKSYADELNVNDTSRQEAIDREWITEVMDGIKLKYGEEWVRCMFRDYTAHIVSMSYDEEPFADAETRSLHMEANAYRMNQFMRSPQYMHYNAVRDSVLALSSFRETESVIRFHIRTLQIKKTHGNEMIGILNDLVRYVVKREQIIELLTLLPESLGGIFPIAVNLLHKLPKVRMLAFTMMQRIDSTKEGKRYVNSLNYFLLLTYSRLTRELLGGSSAGGGPPSEPAAPSSAPTPVAAVPSAAVTSAAAPSPAASASTSVTGGVTDASVKTAYNVPLSAALSTPSKPSPRTSTAAPPAAAATATTAAAAPQPSPARPPHPSVSHAVIAQALQHKTAADGSTQPPPS